MRQWLADPEHMCIKHISGEHLEAHMFINAMLVGKKLFGFYDHKLLFGPRYVIKRHDELAKKLPGHVSPLVLPHLSIAESVVYPDVIPTWEDIYWSTDVLFNKCERCRKLGV
jgi:hypothetical protein